MSMMKLDKQHKPLEPWMDMLRCSRPESGRPTQRATAPTTSAEDRSDANVSGRPLRPHQRKTAPTTSAEDRSDHISGRPLRLVFKKDHADPRQRFDAPHRTLRAFRMATLIGRALRSARCGRALRLFIWKRVTEVNARMLCTYVGVVGEQLS